MRPTADGGITREMLAELAEYLGVKQTAAIHIAVGRLYQQLIGSVDEQQDHKNKVQFADAKAARTAQEKDKRMGSFVNVDLRPGAKNRPGIKTIGDAISKAKAKAKQADPPRKTAKKAKAKPA